VAFSHDSKRLATAGLNGNVKVWDITPQRNVEASLHTEVVATPVRRIDLAPETSVTQVGNLTVSPDSAFAVVVSDHTIVRLWDLKTGTIIQRFVGHRGVVTATAISPDGQRLVTCSHGFAPRPGVNVGGSPNADHAVRVWDTQTGKELRRHEEKKASFSSVAISPDARSVLFYVSPGDTGRSAIRLWDLKTNTKKNLRTFVSHSDQVCCLAFSPDGRLALAGAENGLVHLLSVATGKDLHSFEGHEGRVLSVVFSADGRRALSGSQDDTLRLWDVQTGKQLHPFRGPRKPCLRRGHFAGWLSRTFRQWEVGDEGSRDIGA
jgi:WD40 repeat protein